MERRMDARRKLGLDHQASDNQPFSRDPVTGEALRSVFERDENLLRARDRAFRRRGDVAMQEPDPADAGKDPSHQLVFDQTDSREAGQRPPKVLPEKVNQP